MTKTSVISGFLGAGKTTLIKKLVKEFKTLPYEYGAAIGFSMIVDDLKLLDDAINEASIQMRENKETIETNEKES